MFFQKTNCYIIFRQNNKNKGCDTIMKLKTSSWIPRILMIPCIFVLWVCWDIFLVEVFEEKKYILCFAYALTFLAAYLFFVIVIFWNCIICEIGRKRVEYLIRKKGFHYNYCYNKALTSYCLWINETSGKIAIWNRQEPFTLHEVSAGRITKPEREEIGSEDVLKELSLKLNVDNNPIELSLFYSDPPTLRTSENATIALKQANDICISLSKAKGEFIEDNYNMSLRTEESSTPKPSDTTTTKKNNTQTTTRCGKVFYTLQT